jgi:anti-sigma regulatory factor (Ser/Thr protein kinase)
MNPVSVSEQWLLRQSFPVHGGNFDDAGLVSGRIKSILKERGLASETIRRVALVTYESEINMVSYSHQGKIDLILFPTHVAIEAMDEGPGIPNLRLAMQKGWSTANDRIRELGFGAGMGLNNIRNFSDVFHISSQMGLGTRLKMIIQIPPGGTSVGSGDGST